jgi:hypothetical protein
MRYHKIITAVFIFIFSASIFAQQDNSVAFAKQLIKQKEYVKAMNIMKHQYTQHSDDENIGWLYAHSLHLAGMMNQSQNMFVKLEQNFPANYTIKLDRINKLIEANQLEEAARLISINIKGAPDFFKFEAFKILAKIAYWNTYYDQSNTEIKKALKIYPSDIAAQTLNQKIIDSRSHWLKMGVTYFNDDQPLSKLSPRVVANYYVNQELSTGLVVSYPFYNYKNESKNTAWMQGYFNYHMLKSKADIKVSVGAFADAYFKIKPTASLSINKNLFSHLSIQAGIDYKPYLATTYAIDQAFMMTNYNFSLAWDNPKGCIGNVSYNNNVFSSYDNSYYAVGAWLVSPAIKFSKLNFKAGYGISYSDAKKNSFTAKNSIEKIEEEWTEDFIIDGNYQPFYTPNNQLIHAAVGILDYSVNEALRVDFNLNYGFLAKVDVPRLFLDNDAGNNLFINKDYSRQSFHPFETSFNLKLKLTDNLALTGFYKAQKTYYYKSNLGGISLKLLF